MGSCESGQDIAEKQTIKKSQLVTSKIASQVRSKFRRKSLAVRSLTAISSTSTYRIKCTRKFTMCPVPTNC